MLKRVLGAIFLFCVIQTGFVMAKEAGNAKADPPKEMQIDLGNGVKMEFVYIPAGEFMMGSSLSAKETAKKFGLEPAEIFAQDFQREHPQHKVKITKGFYMGKYEVTVAQFREFVNSSKYTTDAELRGGARVVTEKESEQKGVEGWMDAYFSHGEDSPVVCISWNDATVFCKWVSKKINKTFRLPTDAEWEYACRAGTDTEFSFGKGTKEGRP